MRKTAILMLVLGLAACGRAVITVGGTGGDYATLQEAVNAATGTETIIVNPGTYIGRLNRNITIDSMYINLTIQSAKGPETTIIDAQGLNRVFNVSSINGSGNGVTIKGFTIRNGVPADSNGGGGIYSQNSILTLNDCIVTNNSSVKGGGIYAGGVLGALNMIDCVIENNTGTASSAGGGLHVDGSSLTASNCIFRNNSIYKPYSNAGCMYAFYCDLSFTQCLFEGNSATGNGGVIFAHYTDADFTNCTFANNSCTGSGGVGFLIGGTALPSYQTYFTVRNCIFYNNSATGTADIFNTNLSGGAGAAGVVLEYSYNDLDPAEISGTGTITDLGGNINADPLFVDTDDFHLKSMVGHYVSLTQWVVDDVHSPCIDAGDPSDPYDSEPSPNGDRRNMGFYGNTTQASKSPYCEGILSADLNNDCYVDLVDFSIMAGEWLDCDLIPQALCR